MPESKHENIQDIVKQLASCLQLVKMYSCSHPRAQEEISSLYDKMRVALGTQSEIEIGFIKDEVFYQNQIFFDLSLRLKDFLKEFENRALSVLRIKRGLTKEELERFLIILSDKNISLKGDDFSQYLKKKGIIHIETDKIKSKNAPQEEKLVSSPGFQEQLVFYLNQYQKSLATLEGAFGEFFSKQSQGEEWRAMAESIVTQDNMQLNFLSAIGSLKKHDDYTFVHCLNVALLTNLQARGLGLEGENLLQVTLGGLLHDIGKIYISKYLLNRKSEISAAEFERIKSHAIEGAKLLIQRGGFGKIVPLIAFQHHRHFKIGGGYPRSRFLRPPNFLSRLVTIADVYDALRSRRPYKSEVLVEQIYQIMVNEKGRLFDPVLLDRFFTLIGVWPLGTIVKLNNNYIGMVVAQNPPLIKQPQVEICYDAGYNRLAHSYIVDLSSSEDIYIKRSLHPQGEGEKFIREVLKLKSE